MSKTKRKVNKSVTTEKDVEEVLNTQDAEFMQNQQKLVSLWLNSERLRREIEAIDKELKRKKIRMLWQGIPCPRPILEITRDISFNNLRMTLSELEYVRKGLIDNGFTESNFKDLVTHGKISKRTSKDGENGYIG